MQEDTDFSKSSLNYTESQIKMNHNETEIIKDQLINNNGFYIQKVPGLSDEKLNSSILKENFSKESLNEQSNEEESEEEENEDEDENEYEDEEYIFKQNSKSSNSDINNKYENSFTNRNNQNDTFNSQFKHKELTTSSNKTNLIEMKKEELDDSDESFKEVRKNYMTHKPKNKKLNYINNNYETKNEKVFNNGNMPLKTKAGNSLGNLNQNISPNQNVNMNYPIQNVNMNYPNQNLFQQELLDRNNSYNPIQMQIPYYNNNNNNFYPNSNQGNFYTPLNPNLNHNLSLQPNFYNQQIIPQNLNPHSNQHNQQEIEFLQMRITITNLESENFALKEKLKEIDYIFKQKNSNLNGENKTKITRENSDLKMRLELAVSENDLLSKKLKELKNSKSNNYENINKESSKKEDLIKKLNEENDKLKYHNENLKKENLNLKNSLTKKENEIFLSNQKTIEYENKKIALDKKLQIDEINFRNLREDFDNLTKKYHILKKSNEGLLNNFENSKEENFLLKQEIETLSRKIKNNLSQQEYYRELSRERKIEKERKNKVIKEPIRKDSFEDEDEEENNESRLNSLESFRIKQNQNIKKNKNKKDYIEGININNDRLKTSESETIPKFEHFFPSQAKIIENKNSIKNCQDKVSDLISEKIKIENELFKIPDKQKTVTQINQKRILENKLEQLENEINKNKVQIRDIKNKLY